MSDSGTYILLKKILVYSNLSILISQYKLLVSDRRAVPFNKSTMKYKKSLTFEKKLRVDPGFFNRGKPNYQDVEGGEPTNEVPA